MRQRSLWLAIALVCVIALATTTKQAVAQDEPRRPNVVIIFCDDLGYGDLACFGHPTIATPHLDRMCREGQKWTNFYVAACVCTPSRAGLMTGRLPARNGMASNRRRVLFPDSAGGLPQEEVTIAEVMKKADYATACVGKWHLGHLPQFLPVAQGFDSYFGIPYSNDMDRVASAPGGRQAFLDYDWSYWNVPLMRGTDVVERPANQETITRRYTEEACRFIEENSKRPFFLYLAHSMPHVPLFTSNEFRGVSLRGRFGDVIEEIDWSVGQVLDTLRSQGLAEDTMVVFTSDNGPWLTFDQQGGTAGLLHGGKGSTWDGGMREPTLFWWPGTIPPGVVHDMGSTLDLLPTCAKLAGVEPPSDRVLDGADISPALLGTGPSRREIMYFYRGQDLLAIRSGMMKAHFFTQDGYGGKRQKHDPPLLFHLGHDPGELYNVAEDHPAVVTKMQELYQQQLENLVPPPSHLDARIGQ